MKNILSFSKYPGIILISLALVACSGTPTENTNSTEDKAVWGPPSPVLEVYHVAEIELPGGEQNPPRYVWAYCRPGDTVLHGSCGDGSTPSGIGIKVDSGVSQGWFCWSNFSTHGTLIAYATCLHVR